MEAQPDDEAALFPHHGAMELHPAAPPATTLLHLDETGARVLLGNGSNDDRIDGWYLDSGATHHMTGWREFFSDLDTDVGGSVRFGDDSAVEIKGVGSVIFTAKSGGHRMLTESTTSRRCGTPSSALGSSMRAAPAW